MRKLTKQQEAGLYAMPRLFITNAYALRMAALGGTRTPIQPAIHLVVNGWSWACVRGGEGRAP